MIIETYINRPGKSLVSVILIFLGIYTTIYFQEIQVESIERFVTLVSDDNYEMSQLLWTWGLNLFCALGYVMIACFWLKEVFVTNYYDNYPSHSKVTCLITSILFIVASWLFISFIFTNLSGLVIVSVILALAIYANSNDKK